jgi:NADPH-dependent glutamate synthase beta subunit-like oxidoreductase
MTARMKELEKIIEKCVAEKPAPCTATCPSHVNVRGFIELVRRGKYEEALVLFKDSNPFPAICGRVCHHPCELVCTRGDLDEPVAIQPLHRFLLDWEFQTEHRYIPDLGPQRNERIAIIGSGPAGLSCAYFLARGGYQVVVYERLPIAGGMLSAGIPEFRLPRDIIQSEIQTIKDMGVKIRTGVHVGRDITIEGLRDEGFQAIFLGIGAQECKRLGIEGEHLEGVYSGMDLLRGVRLGLSVSLGSRIAVIGGGNVALDSARTARRLGGAQVFLIYRRSVEEMPAHREEIEDCIEEGIAIKALSAPISILGEKGKVKAIACVRTTPGEIDESGRHRPVPVNDSKFIMEIDAVISAVGEESEWSCLGPGCACRLSDWGTMKVDSLTFQTDEPDIFCGGDAVSGPGTVVEAIEAGKQSAISIDRFLKGQNLHEGREKDWSFVKPDISTVSRLPRVRMRKTAGEHRTGSFKEAALGFSEEEALAEANRCLSCECRICVKNCEFLNHYATSPKELAERFATGEFREDPQVVYSCNLCGLCQQFCPADLNVGEMCMELREELVKEGLGPLKAHSFVRKNQDHVLSDLFSLVLPDPSEEKCERVFFPGCSLPGYSPSITFACYNYLREKLPGTGIVLGCCGRQTLCLGDRSGFESVINKALKAFESLETSEIIIACPECYATFKEYGGDLTLTFITDALLKAGLPQSTKGDSRIFSLHDSCATRWEKEMQESVRSLIRKLGFGIEEMGYCREKTRCCGMGGMIAFANPKLAGRFTKMRAEEAKYDLLTYCASCREALSNYRPALHILDLIFNPEWEKSKGLPPMSGKVRRENQTKLKAMLLESAGDK